MLINDEAESEGEGNAKDKQDTSSEEVISPNSPKAKSSTAYHTMAILQQLADLSTACLVQQVCMEARVLSIHASVIMTGPLMTCDGKSDLNDLCLSLRRQPSYMAGVQGHFPLPDTPKDQWAIQQETRDLLRQLKRCLPPTLSGRRWSISHAPPEYKFGSLTTCYKCSPVSEP